MDLLSLGRHAMRAMDRADVNANGTLTGLPGTVLDAFIPGYGLFTHFIYRWIGFDVSALVTTLVLLFGLAKAYKWIEKTAISTFDSLCMSTAHLDDEDDLFDTVLEFMNAMRLAVHVRAVKVKSSHGSTWQQDQDPTAASVALDKDGIFNYRKMQACLPPTYTPYYGVQSFWHKGHYFKVTRSRQAKQRMALYEHEQDLLELSCVGWSVNPIKALLKEMSVWSADKTLSFTKIRRANPKSSRRGTGWSVVSSRPSRPMSTVILDDNYKDIVVKDMNEFLHPSSPRWYAARGIPYRRGYLFHGPPGTGKTSLSFALAGVFGLDVYCLALNDPELSESDVLDLFNALPNRCIVLLEDIDEAGLKRPDHEKPVIAEPYLEASTANAEVKAGTKPTDTQLAITVPTTGPSPLLTAPPSPTSGTADKPATTPVPTETDRAIATLATALATALEQAHTPSQPARSKRSGHRSGPRPSPNNGIPVETGGGNGISLSGLLNAIDGVATHEGRVLIMTTNHIDALDEALIRTGRVDLRVEFGYASRAQIRELFGRMYGAGEGEEVVGELELWNDNEGAEKEGDVAVRLGELAGLFAQQLPEREFSPSDVQGYLLLHKKSPLQAVARVEAWRDKELRRKEDKARKNAGKAA